MIGQVIVDGSAPADQQDLIASRMVLFTLVHLGGARRRSRSSTLGLRAGKIELTEYLRSVQGRRRNADH
jgi:hypothetical protein